MRSVSETKYNFICIAQSWKSLCLISCRKNFDRNYWRTRNQQQTFKACKKSHTKIKPFSTSLMMSITTWLLATEHTNQHNHMLVQIQYSIPYFCYFEIIQKPVGNYLWWQWKNTFVLKIQQSGLQQQKIT